jgi:hypothetical protein
MNLDWQGALLGTALFVAALIVVVAIVALLNAPFWVARRAWHKPPEGDGRLAYDVDAAYRAAVISVRAGSVTRLTESGFLYLSQNPLPEQRTESPAWAEPEVSA